MRIAALVSGGVDSSVVVHRLKEAGLDPFIFYIRIGMQGEDGFIDCPSEEDIEITSYIAKKYGCKFEVVPLHEEYWDSVVRYTIDTVRRGQTPNPDMMCNKLIKFGVFEERYGKDFDKIATGHYATTTAVEGQTFLSTAADHVKDQTYFLGQISYAQVSKLMFPIGDLPKKAVRLVAENAHLPSATRKDSQGICFLGKINYNDFIRRYLGEKPGKIVEKETGRILGEHKGFWFHTIGQRKGLGLSGGPWYVIEKDIDENVIYVSCGYDTEAQYGTEVKLRGFRYISDGLPKGMSLPDTLWFKIRHTPEFTRARVEVSGEGEAAVWTLQSQSPIQGIASGQFGVLYVDSPYTTEPSVVPAKICLGSGIIA